jgi:hypothetical protein
MEKNQAGSKSPTGKVLPIYMEKNQAGSKSFTGKVLPIYMGKTRLARNLLQVRCYQSTQEKPGWLEISYR